MKQFVIIAVLFLVFQQWDGWRDIIDPPQDYSFLDKTYVTLYATEWCRYCAKARRFLEKNQIAYQEYDIEKSTQAQRDYAALGGGGVPLLLVNDQLVRGYSPSLIKKHLDNIVPVTLNN